MDSDKAAYKISTKKSAKKPVEVSEEFSRPTNYHRGMKPEYDFKWEIAVTMKAILSSICMAIYNL